MKILSFFSLYPKYHISISNHTALEFLRNVPPYRHPERQRHLARRALLNVMLQTDAESSKQGEQDMYFN